MNSASEPIENSGIAVTGMIHANFCGSPVYWIWMCASTVPATSSTTNRMFSPV